MDASVDFLQLWLPGGPWVLTAIEVDRKGIETRTFRDPGEVRAWLDQHEKQNIYFHVNPCTRDLTKKAERTDIQTLSWLHVDIDPRAGEDINTERARALHLLRNPPPGIPAPTCVVFSGGGYQGFWKLRDPFLIEGDLAKAEEAKRYNLQLELLFGADNCHNVDRIMRLPGTTNHPNAKKRAKGRKAELARVEWLNLGEDGKPVEYELSRFSKAAEVQTADDGFAGQRVVISGNIKRLTSVDDLNEHGEVPDWVKVIIVQGNRADDDKPFPSRSEALYTVCCALVRAKVPDDVIYAVITDPDFKISASVLDKGSGAERYATRQIERAHEEVIDPWLRKLNDRYAVVLNWAGKCRVLEEVECPVMKRPNLTRISFSDFQNAYLNQKIRVGVRADGQTPVMEPAGKWWLNHADRRQYNTVIFAPGQEVPGTYNLWRGFAVDARPGDCSLFLDHVRKVVCSDVEEHYEYLLRWMARAVQNPGLPGYSAVVLRGRQGTGKSFFARMFGYLWGRHFMRVSASKHLVGAFNSHLRDCVLLFGDEAFFAGDHAHEGTLKTLITEEVIMIEAKGVDVEVAPNCLHLIMASNEDWVVPAGMDDRRFFVLDVKDSRRGETEYFDAIRKQMEAGGYAALLHYLLNVDLTDFQVSQVPKTSALQQQKELSLSAESEWWLGKLRDGRIMETDKEWTCQVPSSELIYDFIQYSGAFKTSSRSSRTKIGHFLSKACPTGFPQLEQRGQAMELTGIDGRKALVQRPYFYVFPTLEVCRARWDEMMGCKTIWPQPRVVPAVAEEEF